MRFDIPSRLQAHKGMPMATTQKNGEMNATRKSASALSTRKG